MILADFHIFWEGLKRPTSIDTALKTLTVNGIIQRENHPDPNPWSRDSISAFFVRMDHHESLDLWCFPYSILEMRNV